MLIAVDTFLQPRPAGYELATVPVFEENLALATIQLIDQPIMQRILRKPRVDQVLQH